MPNDLTTLYAAYIESLRTAAPTTDLTALVIADRAVVKAAVELIAPETDENEMYLRYLGV